MINGIQPLPLIQLINIWKSYGHGDNKVDALKNIDLKIRKGEFLAICGPSGSGKSTLLNILAGIDKPNSGTAIFLNNALNDLNDQQLSKIRARHLGFIFQFFNLIPVLSVLDNVYYPLIFNGNLTKKAARAQALFYLNSVGIHHLRHRRPSQLSGGQQQRVAIARALANNPDVVVADEPTGNLDIATGQSVLDLLLQINEQTGTTFIISTHSSQLKDRAKRVIEIADGEIVHDINQ